MVSPVAGISPIIETKFTSDPVNDAKLIADTLLALGFALVGNGAQFDLDEPSLRRVVQTFGALTAALGVPGVLRRAQYWWGA